MTDEPLLDRVVAWAKDAPNVVALVLTGSRAALLRSPDEWSDVDVELICDDPAPLVEDDTWLHRFGEVLVYLRLPAEDGDYQTRLVVYTEGQVDFSLCGRERLTGQADGLSNLYRGGYRVLLDKEGVAECLPAPNGRHHPRRPPVVEDFERAVSTFWFEAYHLPGCLARGDLWALKTRDGNMKKNLRMMMEWRALAVDPGIDVRRVGHGMKDWVGEDMWQDLHETWGGFDAPDAHRAAIATCVVFGRVAREVAAAYGFPYPDRAEREIVEKVRGVLP